MTKELISNEYIDFKKVKPVMGVDCRATLDKLEFNQWYVFDVSLYHRMYSMSRSKKEGEVVNVRMHDGKTIVRKEQAVT